MKTFIAFTVVFASYLTAYATPFVRTRVADAPVAFQFVEGSAIKSGLMYATESAEAWAPHDNGAAMEVYKPVLLTTDSVYKFGKYIPFETGSDEDYCQMLGYSTGVASGDAVKNSSVVLATIHDGSILVGSADSLSRITGRRVYSAIRSVTCE